MINKELIKRLEHALHFPDDADFFQLLTDCRAALSRSSSETSSRYVPMTEDELERVWNDHKFGFGISNVSHANRFNLLKALEAKVIRRAGLEVQE